MTASASRRGITRIETLLLIVSLSFAAAAVVPERGSMDRRKQRQECAYRLGLLAKASSHYSMANDGWILGSPNSSGAYLLNRTVAYGPAVQVWDFMGPLAEFYGLGFTLPPESGSQAAIAERFNQIRNSEVFHCPANGFMASGYPSPGGVDAGTGPMISYNTARNQLFLPGNVDVGVQSIGTSANVILPAGYLPKIDRLGDLSRKVWSADGARYSTIEIQPDYDLAVRASFGGTFSDAGSYSKSSRSWDRRRAPGNGSLSRTDARHYGFRHSDTDPPVGAPAEAFKHNLAFYDTHVETQGDLTSTNPHQWLPVGSTLHSTDIWRDTILHFGLPPISLLIN
ncbi:MAG: hypothetical protein AMXMBFR20_25740 [Planctomycetia bacterium]